MNPADTAARAAAIRSGDRRALARAITLVESRRDDHRAEAEALLTALRADTGGAVRIGISGAPGVGKSTFIEAFGLHAVDDGRKLAVLAVDPSSVRGGGAILGDKTRMAELSQRRAAFIRPSPDGGAAGGIARRTREAMLLCEAAGFDRVIVETVGAGQSEVAVHDLVDMFVLLVAPGTGDELQGIKRGIVEIADLVVVTKNDGALAGPAGETQAQYRAALHLLRPATPRWTPRVLACSGLEQHGIAEIWQAVEDFRTAMGDALHQRRSDQALGWMWAEVRDGLERRLRSSPGVKARLPGLEQAVRGGRMTPTAAARALVDDFLNK